MLVVLFSNLINEANADGITTSRASPSGRSAYVVATPFCRHVRAKLPRVHHRLSSVDMDTSTAKDLLRHQHMASNASKSTTLHSIDHILSSSRDDQEKGSIIRAWTRADDESPPPGVDLRPSSSSMDFLQLHLMHLRHQLLMGSPADSGSRRSPEPPPPSGKHCLCKSNHH